MTLISIPSPAPQPSLEFYPVSALNLFTNAGSSGIGNGYNRVSYLNAFGVQAPPFDATRPAQGWFDSGAAAGGDYSFYSLGTDGQGIPTLVQKTIPSAHAACVNLPGSVAYPPYTIAPAGATRGGAPINPRYLCTQQQGEALMSLFGGSGLGDAGTQGFFTIAYSADESRRWWYFIFKGSVVYPALLLEAQFQNGVGAPGRWDTSGPAPSWIPDPPAATGLNGSAPLVTTPMPLRPLMPNEKIIALLMGVGVERTDM